METLTLKSGRVLCLDLAPFGIGNKLRKTVFAALRGVQIEADKIDMNFDLAKPNLGAMDPKMLNTLKNVVCEMMSNDAVEACFFECAVRCRIGSTQEVAKKITRETFDSAEMVGEYLPVAWEVVRFNLAPFFENLDLSSLTSGEEKKPDPPSG